MRTQPAGSLKVQEHPRRKSSELTCSYKKYASSDYVTGTQRSDVLSITEILKQGK